MTNDGDAVASECDDFHELRDIIASQPAHGQDTVLPALVLPDDPLRSGIEGFIERVDVGESTRRTLPLPSELQCWAADNDAAFTWLPQMRGLLRDHWGHQAFRGLQLPVINALMSGRDVFAVMPTGSGKSLCYQLPAMVSDGTTIVVSPLLSLMEDQVSSLRGRGVAAERLGSDTSQARTTQVFQSLANGELQLLYVSPEKIVGTSEKSHMPGKLGKVLQELYDTERLSLLVVDEAHCVSQWGLDFRSDYRKLSCLRSRYAGVPMLAVTASATAAVERDVLKNLKMLEALRFHDTFDRANLFMEVRQKQSEEQTIQELVALTANPTSPAPACGVVYVLARREVDRVCQALCQLGVTACPYHAGLPVTARRDSFTKWMHGDCQLIVATVAFGMGIDKRDVRFVFHIDMPSSIEKYHQEIGRAGRDGRPCRCILWFSKGDVKRNKDMAQRQYDVKKCEDAGKLFGDDSCRHAGLLKYFGERPSCQNCGSCDVCCRELLGLNMPGQAQRDVSAECRKLLQLAEDLMKHGVTASKLRDAARGRKVEGTKAFLKAVEAAEDAAVLKDFSHGQVEDLISKMLQQKVLAEYKDGLHGKGKGKYRKVLRLKKGANADKLWKGTLKLHLPLPDGVAPEQAVPPSSASHEPGRRTPSKPIAKPQQAEDAAKNDEESPKPKRRRSAAAKTQASGKAAKKETSPLGGSRRASTTNAKARLFSPRQSGDDPIEETEAGGDAGTTAGTKWPPEVPDSSGDEYVWVGGGEELEVPLTPGRKRREPRPEAKAASRSGKRQRAAEAEQNMPDGPLPETQLRAPSRQRETCEEVAAVQMQLASSNPVASPARAVEAQTLSGEATVGQVHAVRPASAVGPGSGGSPSQGRRLPWRVREDDSLQSPQPSDDQAPPQATRALPSRAARRNALRVAVPTNASS